MFRAHAGDLLSHAVDRERRRRGMTVAGLARQAGVDPATVRRLLTAGTVRPSTVRLVASALGWQWEDFLGELARQLQQAPSGDGSLTHERGGEQRRLASPSAAPAEGGHGQPARSRRQAGATVERRHLVGADGS